MPGCKTAGVQIHIMQNHIRRWRALWNPDMFHGWGKTRRYFEGWYYKIVDPTEHYAFALIPGVAFDEQGQSHSFIQRLDGKQCTSQYHEFPTGAFQPGHKTFSLQLGDNFFSASEVRLNLPELKGGLSFDRPYRWPKMLGAPGIMGWYSFMPFMECYHGVVSVDHGLRGQLDVYGKTIDFTGGKGYIEKDWGHSFPRSWIWTQSNHFERDKSISVMASVANIPWIGTHFIGYIVGFLWQGRLYRFATYTGARMRASLGLKTIHLAFKDKKYRLEIDAHQAGGGQLVSPILGKMTGKLSESMQSTLEVRFFEKDRLVYSGTGKNAGLEAAGPVEELLTDRWRR